MGISRTGPYPGLLSVFSRARRREANGMTGVAVEAQAALAVNLCKTYGAGHATVRALDNVTVAFERGRFTAVMGPSGSGKSTLMHCMAGLDRPTSGKAYVGGQDIGQLDDAGLTRLRRDRIGFVFQYFNLVPTLTISYMENEVALDVRDDGVGFDPAMPDRGFGHVAMRQRIAALAGTLQVESEPGGGTAVSACVPTVSALASS
jgi:predicted ABC-type transport system involved in lysophospholipase L1 biosynthesis ATPase subunit